MEFTIPKTPPPPQLSLLGDSSLLEVEVAESSEGTDAMSVHDENSFNNEANEMIKTCDSVQADTNASVVSVNTSIPRPSPSAAATATAGTAAVKKDNDSHEQNESSSSPRLKEEINMLYNAVPEIACHFIIIKMIGEGTFSSVYLAKLRHHPEIDQMFALKHIIPTSHPSRIENELRCLLTIGGKDNVMGVSMCLRNRDHVIIVMPYFRHRKFQEILHYMTVADAKDYMKNLLTSLRRVHQFNVIHRDVKPSNFLCNPDTGQYALVDFGLATGPLLTDSKKIHSQNNAINSNTSTSSSSASNVMKSASHQHLTNASTSAGRNRGRSREPLSPSKKDAGQWNLSNITRVNSLKGPVESTTLSATKKFAPNFSSASVLDRNTAMGLCMCFGKPVICELCVARNVQMAPRAGTAGFRSPEVLLKCPDQGTAVDVWAAGVILLSILSARYPFFKANDDFGYLAQIFSLLGTEPCVKAARSCGKVLTLSETIPVIDLESACKKLRYTQMTSQTSAPPHNDKFIDSWSDLTPDAYNLLGGLLDPNPFTRLSAEAALNHPFFKAGAEKNCDEDDSENTK